MEPSARGELPTRMLGVWAHPDDEAFLSAGLMGQVVDAGGEVVCVTATRGERGTPDPDTWPEARLGKRRTVELRASLAALGVTDHRFLGYVDGTLHDIPSEEGSRRVAEVIEEVRPDTVVTFGPEGMTGHLDHIAVSRWVTEAARHVADAPRLLYATTTDRFVRTWSEVNETLGAFGPGLPLATPVDEVALEIELAGEALDRKLVALAAQSSQMAPLFELLGEEQLRSWWATESFTEAAQDAG